MTFKEFQATGRAVADLRDDATIHAQLGDTDSPVPGRIYGDGLFIESDGGGRYCLTLGNSSRVSTNLESLERALYDFATLEGYI